MWYVVHSWRGMYVSEIQKKSNKKNECTLSPEKLRTKATYGTLCSTAFTCLCYNGGGV